MRKTYLLLTLLLLYMKRQQLVLRLTVMQTVCLRWMSMEMLWTAIRSWQSVETT